MLQITNNPEIIVHHNNQTHQRSDKKPNNNHPQPPLSGNLPINITHPTAPKASEHQLHYHNLTLQPARGRNFQRKA